MRIIHAARIRRQRRQSEFFNIELSSHHICSPLPGVLGTMRADLWSQAVHWLPKGLADSNPRPASPSDVWVNDVAYHYLPSGVAAKRGTTLSFRSKWIARLQAHKPLSIWKTAVSRSVIALFLMSLVRAGTYPHGCMHFSKFLKSLIVCPFTYIAAENPLKPSLNENIFQFFSQSHHP